jgi:Dual specificity phosphatase, catalytic domain
MPRSKSASRPGKPSSAKGPSEIAPGVFVGGWKDAAQFEGTRFCVLDEPPEEMPVGSHVPIYREPEGRAIPKNLDRLAVAIGAARGKGERVLVFCGHGVRRGPLAGAWYLHRTEGLTLDEAFEQVRSARPQAEPPRSWIVDPRDLDGA